MIKMIIAFMIGDLLLSLLATKIPLFRRNSKKWEQETHVQRFSTVFFLPLIVFIIIVMIQNYNASGSPSDYEKMLERGEMDYFLVTAASEIGNADIVYEIKKEAGQNEICEIISDICMELNKAGSGVYVYMENGEYIIRDNEVSVGRVIVSEKEYGKLLKFMWAEQ